jgi:Ca2+-binding RTX toxin-like protein
MGVLFEAGSSGQINFRDFSIQDLVDDTGGVEFAPSAAAATTLTFRSAPLPTDSRVTFTGNFVIDAPGGVFNDVISGTINQIESVEDGSTIFTLSGLNMSVATFEGFLATDNSAGFLAAVFAANDTLQGSDNADAMAGFAGNDSIAGLGGSDNLSGDAGNDTLDGDAGSDTLNGGAGNDSLIGGDGNDTFVIDSAKDVIAEKGAELDDRVLAPFSVDLTKAAFDGIEHITLTGTGRGTLTGDEFGNMLIGNIAGNVLDGGIFNDAVGANPNDTLIGGDSGDIYIVREKGDVIVELPGAGVDLVQAFASYTLSAEVDNLTLMGSDPISGFGNDLNNRIIGTDAVNQLEGAAGNDTLTGNGGDDIIDGGAGIDVMTGGKGADQYVVDSLSDKVIEAALPGADRDKVVVQIDNYVLANFVEDLTLARASFAQNASGNALGNVIEGNSFSFNTLQGLAGNDTITGGAGGQDRLLGGVGDDQLTNGNFDSFDGQDTMVGGLGRDLFGITNQGAVVADLDAAPGNDTINLSDDLFTVPPDVPIGNWIATRIEDGSTIISIDTDGDGKDFVDTAVLQGVSTDVDGLRGVNGALTIGGEGPLATNLTTGKAIADNINGTALSDHILGLAGNDTLTGDAGHDTLNGGAGIDSMVGGDGSDTYVVDSKADITVEDVAAVDSDNDRILSSISLVLDNGKWDNIEHVTLTGTAALSLRGSASANMLIGNIAANIIDSTDANDAVVADTLIGGLGNDTYIVGGQDIIIEYVDGGIDQVKASADYKLSDNLDYLTLTGAGDLAGTGNSIANKITGNDGNNSLDGAAGADSLNGGKGDDTLLGATLDTVIFAYRDDGSADLMVGGAGNDTYYVGSLADKALEAAGGGTDTVISVVDYTLGANLENLELAYGGMLPDSSAIRGTGNGFGNQITGNEADNILSGLAGDDTMDGGPNGNDQLLGGDGNDSLTGDEGDTLVGGAGKDQFIVRTAGAVVGDFDAGPGADILELSAGLFTIPVGVPVENWITTRLENGNTVIMIDPDGDATGFVDAVTLIGVSTDLHGLSTVNGALAGGPAAAITSGKAGNDTLSGTDKSDHIQGLAGNDSLTGLEGHDTLDGGAGADVLTGGDGSDTYVVDSAKDQVQEAGTVDSDHDRIRSSVSIDLNLAQYDGIEHVTLTGTAASKAIGDEGNNLLIGNVAANVLDGIGMSDNVESDTLIGGLGNDSYFVDEQDSVIEYADGGIDTVSTSGSIFLSDNVENLVLLESGGEIDGSGNALANKITGNGSDNALLGDAGNDSLTGNAGADSLDGGSGVDTMIGGLNDDSYWVDSAGDLVFETAAKDSGTDLVTSSITYTLGANVENLVLDNLAGDIDGTGNTANNDIRGNDGNNQLSGLAGNDTLNGGIGDDLLLGGVGTDRLETSAGADTMAGGAGSDTFALIDEPIDGVDTLFDFDAGPGGDVLDISDLLEGFDPSTSNLADFVQVTVANGSTLISIDADGAANGSAYVAAVSLQGVSAELDGLVSNGALVAA